MSAHEKILKGMTLNEKVGQLFIIRPDQLDTSLSLEQIHDSKASGSKILTPLMRKTLDKYPAGGFAIFRKNISDPEQLKSFIDDLKNACKIYPVMAVDEEGGRIARIANHNKFNVTKFKSMEAIGRTGNAKNAYRAGQVIGGYLKEYGFTLDFAPVADINTNPENIIIGDRAFGSTPELVSMMAGAYLDGLHAQDIAGCLKHFPGHGDTKDDTHSGYAAVYKTWDELLTCELIPFIDNLAKADSIMTAHVTLESISGERPATLTREIITGKLRDELGYKGVIITDALRMKAICDNYSSAEAALLAFEAGNDIILKPHDYISAFNAILNAVQAGRISEQRLDESVMRILNLKSKY
ncbi:MAG: glycoside hydrolase family 3 protein [Synergistaceae bacterium]|nr:glycoside hydrolase family 3 protein [Synergistaceae bacterium]